MLLLVLLLPLPPMLLSPLLLPLQLLLLLLFPLQMLDIGVCVSSMEEPTCSCCCSFTHCCISSTAADLHEVLLLQLLLPDP